MRIKQKIPFILSLVIIFLFSGFLFLVKQKMMAEPPVLKDPVVIAHRGANDRVNEHTIAAYKIAAKDKVDFLEIDLRMTKDGELIAMHDKTVDRTTNGKGYVKDLPLKYLRQIQTVGVFDNQVSVEPIPTLREILETFTDTVCYYIETRLVNGELQMETPLIEQLRKLDLLEKEYVTIQSFSTKSLQRIQSLAPTIPLTQLYRKGQFNLKEAIASEFPIIGMESTDVTRKNVYALHRAGKQVHVFFHDIDRQEQEQKRISHLQVDGYFTDNIGYTKKLLGKEE